MTAVFDLIADTERHGRLTVLHDRDLDVFTQGFDTQPMADLWAKPAVHHRPPPDRGAGPADFMSLFGTMPIVSARAATCLGSLLDDAGELLPLEDDGAGYFALNVLEVVDLLDEARSEGRWFAPGRLMDLRRLVARDDWHGRTPPVFKLPQWRKGAVLVTGEFLARVRASGLNGLAPRPLGEIGSRSS